MNIHCIRCGGRLLARHDDGEWGVFCSNQDCPSEVKSTAASIVSAITHFFMAQAAELDKEMRSCQE